MAALDKIYTEMRDLLASISTDFKKSETGNKAAAQRVRTGTVKLEKVAKRFRKESIAHEKTLKKDKKPGKKAAASHKSAAKHKVAPKAVAHKAKPKAGAKTTVKGHPFAVKKATAKLPAKHSHR